MAVITEQVGKQASRSYFAKMRGGAALPVRASCTHIATSWLGGCMAIGVVAYLATVSHAPLILGSFGATGVLVFGFNADIAWRNALGIGGRGV